jgi:signal transduction histidine kinase
VNRTTENNELYQHYIQEQARKACLILTALAVGIFPCLILMDYLVYPKEVGILATIRIVTAAFFGLVHCLFRKRLLLKNPIATGWVCLLLGSLSITLLCIALEGSGCPYYVGVFHVAMAGVLILPCDGRQMGPIMASIMGVYFFGIWIAEDFAIKSPSAFVIHAFVLVMTGVICTTAAYFVDKMRKESYLRYLEISRSMEVLQTELASHPGGMEELVNQIIEKKSEVQKALILRNTFISIASHELKTPLTSLQLQMEMGRAKIVNKKMNLEYCEKLINTFDVQLKRILKIVDDMLDVTRIESGTYGLDKTQVNITELVKYIIKNHFFNTDLIALHLDEDLWGNWDPYKIEQVLVNLLSNSIRYGEGKPIIVSVRKIDGEVSIQVKDSGVGIALHHRSKIFDKFERGLASKNYGGLGLGLYITKKIVDAHGGRILVQSEEGQGSEFVVYLPIDIMELS